MERIRKAGALIIQDKRLLIVRPFRKGFFINPGGKYEAGEDAEACLKRELMEELQVSLEGHEHFKTYIADKAAFADKPLTLELYFVKFSGEITPSSEIEVVEWMSKKDFENKNFNVAPTFFEFVPDLIKEGLL